MNGAPSRDSSQTCGVFKTLVASQNIYTGTISANEILLGGVPILDFIEDSTPKTIIERFNFEPDFEPDFETNFETNLEPDFNNDELIVKNIQEMDQNVVSTKTVNTDSIFITEGAEENHILVCGSSGKAKWVNPQEIVKSQMPTKLEPESKKVCATDPESQYFLMCCDADDNSCKNFSIQVSNETFQVDLPTKIETLEVNNFSADSADITDLSAQTISAIELKLPQLKTDRQSLVTIGPEGQLETVEYPIIPEVGHGNPGHLVQYDENGTLVPTNVRVDGSCFTASAISSNQIQLLDGFGEQFPQPESFLVNDKSTPGKMVWKPRAEFKFLESVGLWSRDSILVSSGSTGATSSDFRIVEGHLSGPTIEVETLSADKICLNSAQKNSAEEEYLVKISSSGFLEPEPLKISNLVKYSKPDNVESPVHFCCIQSDKNSTFVTESGLSAIVYEDSSNYVTILNETKPIMNLQRKNTTFGFSSGVSLSYDSEGVTTFGAHSMENTIEGSYSSAFGYSALIHNQGSANTGIGSQSLGQCTTGSSNTGVGTHSLFFVERGYNNVALGDDAGPEGDYSHSISIGKGAKARHTGDFALGSEEAPLKTSDDASSGNCTIYGPSKYLNITVNGIPFKLALYDQ